MKFFDLLILDCDGVLTDGTKTYDLAGYVISKNFCDKDFTAIKKFKAVGVEVIWLSGDTQVNQEVARKRNIDFYCSRGFDDKVDLLPIFQEKYGASPDRMAYVGDDIFDYSIMANVGWPFCVFDADPTVKELTYDCHDRKEIDYKIDMRSLLMTPGENAIADLFNWWNRNGGDVPTLERIKALDNLEKSSKEMSK